MWEWALDWTLYIGRGDMWLELEFVWVWFVHVRELGVKCKLISTRGCDSFDLKKHTLTVNKKCTITIYKGCPYTATINCTITVDNNCAVTVSKDCVVAMSKGCTVTVTSNCVITVGKDYIVTVSRDCTIIVSQQEMRYLSCLEEVCLWSHQALGMWRQIVRHLELLKGDLNFVQHDQARP